MSVKVNVIEVFDSIQGEGKYAGVRQVFARLAGCNLQCSWCDSPQARELKPAGSVEMEPLELWAEIEKRWKGSHSVSITGGEPLMHPEFVRELAGILKVYKTCVYLETNGTLPGALKQVIDDIDIISMDVKLPSSTGCPEFWDEHVEFLRICWGKDVFIKSVISNATTMEDMVKAVEMISRGDPTMPLFLQPNHFEINSGVMDKCREFQQYALNYLSDVRIIPQMHKFMNIR